MISAVWCLSSNFGDALTPWIIEKLTGSPPVYAQGGADYEHHIVAGSMLNHANGHSTVWGAGIANWSDGVNAHAKLLAVRGPISRMRAINCGAKCPPIYGDPGLILPRLYTPTSSAQHAIGIVPHYVDQYRAYTRYEQSAHVVNILGPIGRVIDEITSCKAIISSSLHGLVVAHAYGIPAIWAKISDSVGGDDTKFRDYFLSVEIEPYSFADLRGGGLCEIPSEVPKINTERLWGACPFR